MNSKVTGLIDDESSDESTNKSTIKSAIKSTNENTNENIAHQHYEVISRAIAYIRGHVQDQPSLQQIAEAVHLSEFHLQRVFASWAGISPKRFLQFVTKERALAQLAQSQDLLNVALESGLSGTGRLHDLLVTCEAMTPGQIKTLGKDLTISYGRAMTPFGAAIFAWTGRGLCHLEFLDHDSERDYQIEVEQLRLSWPYASLKADAKQANELAATIFNAPLTPGKIHLVVKGTNFQLKVWQALLKTSGDQLVSYGQLANMAGSPKAQRAVGSALAANNIALLIPCHRVIRGNGELGNYRWGENRKLAIQLWQHSNAI
ncbi:MAG: methylated-DNA--[protein]-cysteine S-methyltransferase [Gammaproteobacteria bacterium]|nr:methylated-DNA--[protein]-cysteine S-methyltransferase [Gammaproteobacteria bacterium]